jgi:DNA-binding MarR family transcriptional regulator
MESAGAMNEFNDLERVLAETSAAIERRDWQVTERLSERVRGILLDALLWDQRDQLGRMRDRLMAFRSAVSILLDPADPVQAGISMLVRSDAGLAALASRKRPSALAAADDQDSRSATDRILAVVARRTRATTTDIVNATGLAQGTVSRMLTDLRARGLVTSRRVGKKVFTQLTPRGESAAGQAGPGTAPIVTIKATGFLPVLSDDPDPECDAQRSVRDFAMASELFNATPRSFPSPGTTAPSDDIVRNKPNVADKFETQMLDKEAA